MNYKLVGAALLALAVVATGAVAAAPGNAPVDAPSENRPDQASDAGGMPADAGSADSAADAGDDGEESNGDAAGERGPPADLPGQVPDFVGEIHDLIGQQIDGALDGVLGDHVSDVTPEDGEDPASAQGNATAA